MNIPCLREYFFTGGFFSSRAPLFPTGKHPHNCMFSIYPKKNKREENSYIYIRIYGFVLYA